MATIDDIIAAVQAMAIDTEGTLTLQASSFPGIEVAQAFFTRMLGAPALAIRQARREPGTATMVIFGVADFYGYSALGTTLTYDVAGGYVTATLAGTMDRSPVQLPVVTWVEVDNISLTATITEPYQLTTFRFSADLTLQGEVQGSVPIDITQSPPSGWQIGIADQAGTAVTVDQLVALIGGHGLSSFLPQDLVSILDGFSLTDLTMQFDTETRTVGQVTAGLTVTNGWPVAPGISLLPGLQVLIAVANPGDDTRQLFTGIVTGSFDLDGTTVPVYVKADVAGGASSWLVGLDPASSGVTIPSLSGLFALAGGAEFAAALPPGLKDIPAIQVSPLLIGFTLGSPAQLQQVQFGASTTSPWPVVPDFLTLEQLSFDFQLVGLAGGQRGIGCVLSSTVAITDAVWLYFVVRKDPASVDWTLSGGLAPGHSLNLTDLVARLLASFVTLPAHAPELVLDTAAVTVVPGRSVSLSAGSVTPWPLLDSVVLSAWTLGFQYDAAAAQKFTGSLSSTLTLAGVPVTIAAGLDASGTWSFAGSTQQGAVMDVGDLITDLANRFQVSAVPAGALHGLTIANIHVKFAAGSQPGSPAEFSFGCLGVFSIAGQELDAQVDVDIRSGSAGYTGTFTGTLTVKTAQQVTEQIAITLLGGVLTATWTAAPGHGLRLTDLASAFGFTELPALPGLEFGLQSLSFSYDVGQGTLVLSASTLGGSKAVLVSAVLPRGDQSARVYAFAVDVPLGVRLADLPLVGDKLPDADQLGIPDLGCWVLSDALTKAEAGVLNGHVPAGYPRLPDTDVQSGVLLFGTLQLGADQMPLTLPIGPAAAPKALPAGPAAGELATGGPAARELGARELGISAAPPGDGTKWFAVERTFGVFSFQRIGVQYQSDGSGTLFFLLDASIMLGPVTFSAQGLGIGSPLTHFSPAFHLSGLGLSYQAPPLSIQGALYALPAAQLGDGVSFQYDGDLVVAAEKFGLAAIGSYARLASGDPSLFVFAQLRMPLGGPPAFFVTGLMGGFGFNRSLTLPAQDEVSAFPLLALGAPAGPGQPAPAADPSRLLGILEGTIAPPGGGAARAWIAPRTGEYWLAVGLEFSSFELVDTRAMLVAEFGTEFALALLGVSTLRLPQAAPDAETYLYIELELEAVFQPAGGFFGLTAVLSQNSYLLAPAAKLTGGFAFYAWFGDNANAGQFVITIGGYHPAFTAPPYFPRVPAVGLNWAVSDVVTVKGSAYFALTTSCVMAGGGLEVLFQSGNLSAWFTAQANLLVSWNPFAFLADIGVSIGVSYKLDLAGISKTLSISVGASVSMWGPPTGGTVTVHLYIVSFTVEFGARQSAAAAAPLTPPQFAGLIPAAPVTASITGGLAASVDDPAAAGQKIWLVRTGGFTFATESAIPAATLAYGGTAATTSTPVSTGLSLDVRPMDLKGTPSTQTIRVQDLDNGSWHDLSTWSPAVRSRPMPASLWGAPLTGADGNFTQAPSRPSADVVANAPVGAQFSLPGPQLGASTGLVSLDELAYEPVTPPGQPGVLGQSPLAVSVAATTGYLPSFSPLSVGQVAQVAGAGATAGRTALLQALTTAGLYAGGSDPMSSLAAGAEHLFTDPPLLVQQ